LHCPCKRRARRRAAILAIYPASLTSHDPTTFCQFAKAVVDRYDAGAYGVTEYVIGTESNQDAFWQPQVAASGGVSLSAPASRTCSRPATT
jgi:hypothetical protein